MASFDHCYCDQAYLPVTQSSNGCRDVGGPLLLGVRIIMPKSRRPSLLDWACLSVTQCRNGYESLARCYCEFEVPCPIIKASLRICHDGGYKMLECRSLSLVQPITLSLSKLSLHQGMASNDNNDKRKLEEQIRTSS
jgi:hypothetical protein